MRPLLQYTFELLVPTICKIGWTTYNSWLAFWRFWSIKSFKTLPTISSNHFLYNITLRFISDASAHTQSLNLHSTCRILAVSIICCWSLLLFCWVDFTLQLQPSWACSFCQPLTERNVLLQALGTWRTGSRCHRPARVTCTVFFYCFFLFCFVKTPLSTVELPLQVMPAWLHTSELTGNRWTLSH